MLVKLYGIQREMRTYSFAQSTELHFAVLDFEKIFTDRMSLMEQSRVVRAARCYALIGPFGLKGGA